MNTTIPRYLPVDLKVPGLTREAVSALDALIPERCPDIHDSERAIWIYAGKRELVNFLKRQMEITEYVVIRDG